MAKTSNKANQDFVESFSRVRNRVINGAFDYWQRATSFSDAADFAFLADRFQNRKSAGVTSTINVFQSTDLSSESSSTYSMRIENSGVSAALGATDIYAIRHAIEGINIYDLYNGSVTLKFKVKANHTATYGVSSHDDTFVGADSQYKTFTIDQANTWEEKEIEYDLSTGTYNSDTSSGVEFWFTFAAGATYWQGDAIDNFVGTNGNEILISDVMVVKTDVKENIDFKRAGNDLQHELDLCMRYFQNTRGGGSSVRAFTGGWDGNNIRTFEVSTVHVWHYYFKVPMRVGPVLQLYHPFTGDPSTVFRRFDNVNGSASVTNVKPSKLCITGTAPSATSGNSYIANAEFDSEL